jgi:hypothetical protein
MSAFKKHERRSIKHADKPRRGDYWHECFCPILIVIESTKHSVTYVDETKAVDKDHFTFDPQGVKTITRKEFAKKMRYSSENLNHKCWGMVEPKRGKKWVDAYESDTQKD